MDKFYIYSMPPEEWHQLCVKLDQDDKWEKLGIFLMVEESVLNKIKLKKEKFRETSPSDELLFRWGNHNHTVLQLFTALNHLGFQQEMSIIKNLVPKKYHPYLKKTNNLVVENENEEKKLQIPNSKVSPDNFNNKTTKGAISNKLLVNDVIDNNNLTNHQENSNSNNVSQNSSDDNYNIINHVISTAGTTPHITYLDLTESTNNWHSHNILGKGGFAMVFRGIWKNTEVAIKRLESRELSKTNFVELIRQSITELHCLNAYKHDNILPIYGYSIDNTYPCLVYKYMSGGCLERRIRIVDKSKLLMWSTRLNIAIGTARGLQFMHTTLRANKPLIHGDIKSANILLDAMNEPKIGDFGLAREGPDMNLTHIILSRAHGTRPYVPEEFMRSLKFSTKIDTYSFGVVLFELATGKPAMWEKKQNLMVKLETEQKQFIKLRDYVLTISDAELFQLKDNKLDEGDEIFKEFIRIGKLCVQHRPKDRPEMVNVLEMLEKVAKK